MQGVSATTFSKARKLVSEIYCLQERVTQRHTDGQTDTTST